MKLASELRYVSFVVFGKAVASGYVKESVIFSSEKSGTGEHGKTLKSWFDQDIWTDTVLGESGVKK